MTLALLSTIALGIGSNVSIYGFARGLIKPNPALDGISRVVSIFAQDTHGEGGAISSEEYLWLKRHPNAFEWIGAAHVSPVSIRIANQSSILSVASVSSQLASALNLSMGKGVFISYQLWQSALGGTSDVRGQKIRIGGSEMCVSGVAQRGLEGLYRKRAVDIWMPLEEQKLHDTDRQTQKFWVLAGLRRGMSIAQAQHSVRPGREASRRLVVLPYTGVTPETAQGMLRIGILFGLATGALLFIACANVVSFLLGRAFARSYETSVRIALGAGRVQLAGEALYDSAVIAVAGGALAILLSVWTAHVVPALLFEEDAQRLVFTPSLLSIFTASIGCIAITILCGLIPVFAVPSERSQTVLRRESAGPSRAITRFRAVLAIAQMTSCCVLVVSTAILLNAFRAALETNAVRRLGDPILVTVQAQRQPDGSVDVRYFQGVEQALQSNAGFSKMAWAGRLPGSQPAWRSFRIEPSQMPLRDLAFNMEWFTAKSLTFFRLPPSEGHLFGVEDQKCRVAIVNEKAAAELFGRHTVGRTIQESSGLPVQIIGVVAEKSPHPRNPPTIYYSFADLTGPAPHRVAGMRFRAPIPSELASAELDANVVSQDYFDAIGFLLTAGQSFRHYRIPEKCRIGVINQEAADLYFDGKAVGAAVIDDLGVRTEIVGIIRSRPFGIFERHAEPAIYLPMWQDCLPRMTLIGRARPMNNTTIGDLRHRIEALPGHGPAPVSIKSLSTHLSQTALAPLRIATMTIGASAVAALMMSILGLFGALSDIARQRQREVAIRLALGAQRWHIIYLVMREGGRLAGAAALLGTLGSLWLSRFLAAVIPGNRSPVLWVWLAAPLALALAVLVSSVLPARQATLLNPVVIMRAENN